MGAPKVRKNPIAKAPRVRKKTSIPPSKAHLRKDSNRKLSPDYQAKKKQVAVDNTDKNNDRRQQIADALQTASDSLYGKMESGGAFGSTGPSGSGAESIDKNAQLRDYEIKSFNPTQTTRLRKDEY